MPHADERAAEARATTSSNAGDVANHLYQAIDRVRLWKCRSVENFFLASWRGFEIRRADIFFMPASPILRGGIARIVK
jgi:hypothetical protein